MQIDINITLWENSEMGRTIHFPFMSSKMLKSVLQK